MYRFGIFEADEQAGELRKHGRPRKVRGRPFDILMALLQRPGAVVTREELRGQLWPADTFVDFDHGLNSAMNRLREALGDSAENPRFIETLPKRGYRFIAPVEAFEAAAAAASVLPAAVAPAITLANDGPSAPPSESAVGAREPGAPAEIRSTIRPALSRASRVVLVLATTALAAAVIVAWVYLKPLSPSTSGRMTLAVLPFDNLSSDAEQDYFSDGFTEEMITELGRLDPEHLGVIARTTSMLYKGARKSVGQIRQELGVDYVLEGSIRRSGSRLRISAQLVQARQMTHLWSESYDRDVADSLTIQSEVAMKIAKALELALKAPQAAAAPKSFPAYELVLRGRFFREQATEESARKAIEYFQRAIALDPQFGPAYSGAADAYLVLAAPGWEVDQPATLFQKRSRAPSAPCRSTRRRRRHAVLSLVRLNYAWDRAGAETEIKESIRLNRNFALAHQYYSTVLTTMGRFDEAIGEARRAIEIDPLSAPAAATLGIRFLYARRCDEASAQFARTLDSRPEFGVAHWGIAQCARERGDTTRELDELHRAVELSGNSAYMRAHLAYGLAAPASASGRWRSA